ncbi:FGGY-family carbohydrate kinase [Pseudomonas syringae]|nr:FGGY-family carbohydrate kinase [Pseudomonas syringae]
MSRHFIGVDVGTGSARAGVFDASGRLLAAVKAPLEIWHSGGQRVEQSAEQIWQAIVSSVRGALDKAGVAAEAIAGIGFDATCSLVVVTAAGDPVGVGDSGDDQRNVMVWMDHRATAEAIEITATGHPVLRYVGGRMSPEMETPKLLWLKRHQPQAFDRAGHFFDLADYLTWRATGDLARSSCTVTCKWTYLAHEQRWDASYFQTIGLGELAEEGFVRLGKRIVEPGTPLGQGLCPTAAAEFGLLPGTAVGAALIDAHAGGVGSLGGVSPDGQTAVTQRLAYIFGTSACSMASSPVPAYVDGVWGPYYSAMLPGLWLTEGGQSAAGSAIDHLVSLHPAVGEARETAERQGQTLLAWLEAQVAPLGSAALSLADGLHVVPEFLGNRSPFADPDARAVLAGLTLDRELEGLSGLYVAGLCGIAYGLRQLLEALSRDGIRIELIVASGGAAQSDFVRQLLADATGVPVAVSDTEEPVLRGAAMLGAVAAEAGLRLLDVMERMASLDRVFTPVQGALADQHRRRYAAFEVLQAAEREVRSIFIRE